MRRGAITFFTTLDDATRADLTPAFRFAELARRLEPGCTLDGSRAIITGPEHLYDWTIGTTTPPRVLPTSSLLPDGGPGYNSGPVVAVGESLFFIRYRIRDDGSAGEANLMGDLFARPYLCAIEPTDDGGRRLVRYEPHLVDETDERPGQIIDLRRHGNLLVGQTRRAVLVVRPDTMTFATFAPHAFNRTENVTVGPHDIAAAVLADGTMTAVPLPALAARATTRLQPAVRVTIPERYDALR